MVEGFVAYTLLSIMILDGYLVDQMALVLYVGRLGMERLTPSSAV